MRKIVIYSVSLGLIAALLSALTAIGNVGSSSPPPPQTLPPSLDRLYPPAAEAPVYLLAMIELGAPFSAIVVDVLGEDWTNAEADFNAFKGSYVKTAAMVPEWNDLMPLAPLDTLGAAISAHDRGQTMAAYEKVGAACHACHAVGMVPVQQRYHWGDFETIVVGDSLTKGDLPFARLMRMMETSLTGSVVDVQQGQIENARRHFEHFNVRFQSMTETCVACHESERRYFVDDQVQQMIAGWREQLYAPTPDAAAIGRLTEGIGMESCHKCHLVHLPAAYSPYRK